MVTKSQGFTLLELMLVVAIAAMVLVLVQLEVPHSQKTAAQFSVTQLNDLVQYTQDQAILTRQPQGVVFLEEGYFFVELQGTVWQKSATAFLGARTWPQDTVAKVTVDGTLQDFFNLNSNSELQPHFLVTFATEQSSLEVELLNSKQESLAKVVI